ncbi:MAG: hypothetical protein CVV57_03595 [Tenericutes bacterium HGW-Tenericutes-2]|jgi:hypothetical protein|nr:MAG: hypothetical protein CVV57_03595 [Tenericutes bacterium HGW-Tenericutes-2]
MKQMLKSVIMLITSILLFTAVVYAWFTISNDSYINPVNVGVTNEFDYDFEVRYYTKDYVYRYNQEILAIQVYDTSTSSWISPTDLPGGTVYLIDGVFISQYDVLIPENNIKSNLIMEISVTFKNTAPLLFSQKMISNTDLSSQVISSMILETSRPYYVSEVSNIQTLLSDSYNHYAEEFNKYSILNTEFGLVDGSSNLIYPKHSFYQNGSYQSTLLLGDNVIYPGSTERYYYNFSYDAQKVNQFFTAEFQSTPYDITNIPAILFFQDIQVVLIGGNS